MTESVETVNSSNDSSGDIRNDSSTAVALLDAAESAFAEHGTEAVSLRSIMRAAGANPAAVHYHYGSRAGLTTAVVDRILGPLQRRRLELLAAAVDDAGPQGPTLHDLLGAIIRPDLEAMVAVGRRNPGGVRLIGALYSRPSAFVKAHVEQSFAPVAHAFMPHLMAAVPSVEPADLAWRIRWAVFGLLGAVLSDDDVVVTEDSLEAELARIVSVTAGALCAPPTIGVSP